MSDRRPGEVPGSAEEFRRQGYHYLYYPPHAKLRSLAITFYAKALALEPENVWLHVDLASAYRRLGQMAEAKQWSESALALASNALRIQFRAFFLSIPPYFHSVEEAEATRRHLGEDLLQLLERVRRAEPAEIVETANSVGEVLPASLVYQDATDHELQKLYGTLVCKLMAQRYREWATPPIVEPPAPGEPIRVGIVYSRFHNHGSWHTAVKGWVTNLDSKRFRLYGYTMQKHDDAETEIARRCFYRFTQKEISVQRWAEMIRKDRLHVLIYPQLGLNSIIEQLGSLRLAPVQCSTSGFFFTSGFPTIDYYLGSDLIEPPDADEHYAERLVRLPNLSFYLEPNEVSPAQMTRADWGMRDAAVVYLCSQAPAKYHPRYDDLYARIASQVEDCQFVFFERQDPPTLIRLFQRRLGAAFAAAGLELREHVVFVPWLPTEEYHSLHAHGDVFLDSIDVSGVTTTIQALPFDLPIVTLRGRYQRGRTGSAILTMMGMAETIAANVEEYVALAVKLGRDAAWRAQIRAGMAQNRHKVYRDRQVIVGLETFLEQVVRGKP